MERRDFLKGLVAALSAGAVVRPEWSIAASDIRLRSGDHDGRIYDIFVWEDAGTLRISHGHCWRNLNSRGADAEASLLANKSTYAGSIYYAPKSETPTALYEHATRNVKVIR